MNVRTCLAPAMDAKNSPHELSPSSAVNSQDQHFPALQKPETYMPTTPVTTIPSPTSNVSKSPADDEANGQPSATQSHETSHHDNPGKNAMSRLRKPRKPNGANGKSALFWVHMDPQSVSEGTREDTLKRIRSHVMSEHNRKKRMENTKRYKTKAWKHLAFQPVETAATKGQTGPSRINSFSTESPDSSFKQEFEDQVTDAVGFPTHPSSSPGAESHDVEAVVNALPPSGEFPWTYLGAGAKDPFSMTHTPLSDRMWRHLQHCKRTTYEGHI